MAVLKADEGFSVLIITGGEWRPENVRRIPVIAWNIGNDGIVTPITPMPWVNNATEFTLEMPDESVIASGRTSPDASQYFPTLAGYVAAVREVIANAPQRGEVFEEVRH